MIPRFARVLVLPVLLAAGVGVGAAAAQEGSAPPPRGAQVRKACAADIQRLCPDAQPGRGGGLRMCLRDHQNDLSDDCRSALAAARQRLRDRNGADSQPPAPNGPPQP